MDDKCKSIKNESPRGHSGARVYATLLKVSYLYSRHDGGDRKFFANRIGAKGRG